MAGGQRGHVGGIASLRQLIGQHREALEYDLIALGLRLEWLGSEALSWRDLWVIVRQSPRSSALMRAMHPESAEWGLSEQLQALLFDALQIANWQRAGGKRGDLPAPLPRPGVEPRERVTKPARSLSMDEMAKRLGWEVSA